MDERGPWTGNRIVLTIIAAATVVLGLVWIGRGLITLQDLTPQTRPRFRPLCDERTSGRHRRWVHRHCFRRERVSVRTETLTPPR